MREREKLYTQMEFNFDELSTLDPNKLFLHLKTEKRQGEMSFKYYSEFLNIFNTILFFFSCSKNIKTYSFDVLLFISLDSTFIISSLLYYFIIKNKKVDKKNSNKIFIFALVGLVLSKFFFRNININTDLFFNEYINNEITQSGIIPSIPKFIKANFAVMSLFFLVFYDYSANSIQTSSIITKVLYTIMAFLMTYGVGAILIKIRIFFYSINYFEFIPEIRKFITHFSFKNNVIAYMLNFTGILIYLIYVREYEVICLMFAMQIFMFVFYSNLFNYFYKRDKKPIIGLWDLPEVTSYY